MKFIFAALLAVPALALAQAAEPQPDELLQLAFPKWLDEEGGRVQTIPTNAVTRYWDRSQGKKRKVIVTPGQVVRVAPDRIVLLASMTPVSADGVQEVSHGTPIGLAAYTFRPGKDGWKLAKRQEPFDLEGFEGEAKLSVVPLTAASRALHVSWGSCWQGHCVDLFALYAIGADGVKPRPLVLEKIKGGNINARPDCVDRLDGRRPRPLPPSELPEDIAPGDCYAIEGRWDIASAARGSTPGALTLRFNGLLSPANYKVNTPAKRVDQTMKFEFRGGRYVPVSGSNPVPNA